MNEFIQWLENLNSSDTKVRAVLRRSLAFEPGAFVQSYPYVEPFLQGKSSDWRRRMLYLVAGVWAAHWRPDRIGTPVTIAKACALQKIATGSSSTEKRFIALLDADVDQLPNRLRHMTALLKDYPIDFEALLTGLVYWPGDQKRTQNEWARDFYLTLNQEASNEQKVDQEISI